MAEESDARIERLEKGSQDQQGQMAAMMEMLRTLVRDKAQATSQQSGTAQPEQRRKDPAYLQGFTPPYTQAQPMPQIRGFPYDYAPPRHRHMKWGRTLRQTRSTQ